MLFSSIEFLFYFLPVALAVYFITPAPGGSNKPRNYVLLVLNLIFYAWGGPPYLLLMGAQMLSGWGFGLLAERWRGKRRARAALIGSIVVGIGCLMYFKYADFFLTNINALFRTSIPLLKLALPLGISFYTFQVLSYVFDVYMGKIKAQRDFGVLCAYVTLFPQLIAGPIVRYADVERDLIHRKHSPALFAEGARRLAIGLGKKVLIANVLAELVKICQNPASLLGAWLYLFAFAFQLYFDFSGYSDMAIGMGKMFGFRLLENFNYPYTAKSVTDFWRRWHISMSSWFRDYVYIPLGGNRVKLPRHIFNIMVVWLLTGFWHGAGWNFMAWGVYFGLLLLFEKFFFGRILDKLPRIVSHIYLILCVAVGWTLFDAAGFGDAASRIACLFGAGVGQLTDPGTLYYLRSYAVPLLVAAVGCTPLPSRLARKLAKSKKSGPVLTVLEPLTVVVLLAAVTAYLVDGSFNPFIYFRF